MKRTTVYLEEELELRLKAEARRLRQPMAELIREALRQRLDAAAPTRSRHAGGFASGHRDTAERADDLLRETDFGASE